MKKILVLMSLISLALMITFTSCKKDDEEVVADPLPEATITGLAEVELDWTNTTPETAPSGTKVFASVWAGDLVETQIAGYDYQTFVYEGSINGDGVYTIKVPAKSSNAKATITFADFEEDVIVGAGVPTVRTIFTAGSNGTVINVVPGGNYILDAGY